MNNIFDDIKARVDIVQLVSGYTALKKAGRNFKGLCPFHNEKTPSFMVSPEKQIAYCFGCHKGGDIFAFIREVEHFDTAESVNFLAEKAGVQKEKYKTQASAVKKEDKEIIKEICEMSARFYEEALFNSESGKKVLEYIRGRGVTDEFIKKFRLGFAPDSYDSLYNYLIKLGFPKNSLIDSGQISSKNITDEKVYDRFRLRLMFPILNAQGSIVGFGGRVLKKGDEPKYLNSPDTPVYSKSNLLYGWHIAKDEVRKNGKVIFVEGYFDVISAHQAGFSNTVATSGTALTPEQVNFVKRFATEVYLSFDSDGAGMNACLRATEMLATASVKAFIINLGEFKDPDEACKAGKFQGCIQNAKYYLDYYFDDVLKVVNSKSSLSALEKIDLAGRFLTILAWSKEGIEISHYISKLAKILSVSEDDIRSKFSRILSANKFTGARVANSAHVEEFAFDLYSRFLGYLCVFPSAIKKISVSFDESSLPEGIIDIYKAIIANYNGTALDFTECLGELSPENAKIVQMAVLRTEQENPSDVDSIQSDAYIEEILTAIRQRVKKGKSSELTRSLRQAEELTGFGSGAELLKEKQNILIQN